MKAVELYERLERDFVNNNMRDEWAKYMGEIGDYLSVNFKERSMGLVCDFAEEIKKVCTAVFPSDDIMRKIIDDGIKDAMLFVHHPSIWDIRSTPIFQQMKRELLDKFRENRISIFNYHVPLDNFGGYSTSKTLADALDIEIEKPFAQYYGGLAGIIGKTKCKTVKELNNKFSQVAGHETKIYLYGDDDIKSGRVAVVAGGGNDIDTVSEMIENKVNLLITGITAKSEYSSEIHKFEQENRINILGGTHYSTEKFACIKMCGYFNKLGLESIFLEDEPIFEDM